MSLFQLHDYWSCTPDTTINSNEQSNQINDTDTGCLVIGNIDNNNDKTHKIVTGNYAGQLRIYKPSSQLSPPPSGNNTIQSTIKYNINDLLYEIVLDSAIIQLALGQFNQLDTSQLCLAVLHEHKLVVYNCTYNTSRGTQLNQLYEIRLNYTAYNMCYGKFNHSTYDHILIQTLDCHLLYIEYTTVQHTIILPLHYILPGSLLYIESCDTIVITNNINYQLDYIRINTLIAYASTQHPNQHDIHQIKNKAINETNELENDMLSAYRPIEFIYSTTVYEHILDLQYHNNTLYALSEHYLYCINCNTGLVSTMLKLDYEPVCMRLYQSESNEFIMICTTTHQFMIYSTGTMKLLWCAKSSQSSLRTTDHDTYNTQEYNHATIVEVYITSVNSVNGLICYLLSNNTIVLSYLGVEPPLQHTSIVTRNNDSIQSIDYNAMNVEHKKLNKIIKQLTNNTTAVNQTELVTLSIGHDYGTTVSNNIPQYSVQLTVSHGITDTQLSSIQVNIDCDNAIQCNQSSITIDSLANDYTATLLFTLTEHIPVDLSITIYCAYTTQSNQPRIVSLVHELPLTFICIPVSPSKHVTHMITLDTSGHIPPKHGLIDLFADELNQLKLCNNHTLYDELIKTAANVITFQYRHHGKSYDCTILLSPKSGRYRIQSNYLHCIYMISRILCHRLNQYYKSDSHIARYTDPINMDLFYTQFTTLYQSGTHLNTLHHKLQQHCIQYRNIQKRLLLRYKDKHIVPMNGLHILCNQTYDNIQLCIEQINEYNIQYSIQYNQCKHILLLLIQLVTLKYRFNAANYQLLKSYWYTMNIDTTTNDNTNIIFDQLYNNCVFLLNNVFQQSVTKLDSFTDIQYLIDCVNMILIQFDNGNVIDKSTDNKTKQSIR